MQHDLRGNRGPVNFTDLAANELPEPPGGEHGSDKEREADPMGARGGGAAASRSDAAGTGAGATAGPGGGAAGHAYQGSVWTTPAA